MSDKSNPDGVATQTLNGGWFRRERERIAVGRKPMALRLGTTESKLAMLELRKQDVPPQWLGVLAELGFRIPKVADAAATKAATPSKSQSADSDITTPADAPTAETEHQQYPQGEEEIPFCGHWLANRLQQNGIRPRDAVKHLATRSSVLSAVERLNIPLPLEWIPRLLTLGVFTVAEAKAVMRLPHMTSSMKNGMWLGEQRRKCGLTHSDVAAWLGVSCTDVRLVEARKWPLPDEWFPTLTDLFAPPRMIRKTHTAAKMDAATQKDSATQKHSESRQSAPQASTTDSKAETPAPAPRPAHSQSAHELIETIMNYRMMLGECSGLSAIEVLAQITADLQFALAKDALSYDQLRAAMKAITAR